MAYSAGLGETDSRYYDTARTDGLLVHPLFPVSYEWPVSQPIRHIPALRPHFSRIVHAEHDLLIHRAPREGDRLKASARIIAVSQRKPGAFVVFRFESRDAAGKMVTTTDFGVFYRGVPVEGPDRLSAEPLPPLPAAPEDLKPLAKIPVAATAAHVYTECARIWNPIHTDIAHARAAGLPGILLHGTATLALSISHALAARGADPARVRRVQCRFTGMVLMPSTLELHGAWQGNDLAFETRGASGDAVISRGRIQMG